MVLKACLNCFNMLLPACMNLHSIIIVEKQSGFELVLCGTRTAQWELDKDNPSLCKIQDLHDTWNWAKNGSSSKSTAGAGQTHYHFCFRNSCAGHFELWLSSVVDGTWFQRDTRDAPSEAFLTKFASSDTCKALSIFTGRVLYLTHPCKLVNPSHQIDQLSHQTDERSNSHR